MNNTLQQLLSPMNIFFGVTMVLLFFWSLFRIIKNPKESTTIPNLIASLGIIGTFAGIFGGLLEFDTVKLDDSIPKLLDGMKTAFATSLVGLTLSNILKSTQSSFIKKLSEKDREKASLEVIASLMYEMKEAIVNSNKEVVNSMEENKSSIKYLIAELVGDKNTSLTGQMKLMRENLIEAQEKAQERLNTGLEKMGEQLDNLVETNNAISTEIERGNNTLIEEFRVFAKNMAENNMKAFTEAIQECIRDLNNQLQEQFGENFKHLNYAVEKLLEWQIHYKETIEKTNENQIEIYKGMTMAKNLIIEINERSQSIVEVANKLGDKIVTFDTQQQTLNKSIEVLNKISRDSMELVPNIDKYLSETKEQILESTQNIENYVAEVDEKIFEHTTLATDQITDHVVKTTKKSIEEVSKSSLNILEKINIIHKKVIENMDEISLNTFKNIEENNKQIIFVRNSIKELTQVSTENIKKQQNEIILALKNLTTAIEATSDLNIKAMEGQITSIEKAVARFENEGFTLTKKISDNIQVMVENNNSNLTTSIHNLNESLAVTLNNSLQSLGEQLAAVSEKFVSDYTPLTIELQKIVHLAKRVG